MRSLYEYSGPLALELNSTCKTEQILEKLLSRV